MVDEKNKDIQVKNNVPAQSSPSSIMLEAMGKGANLETIEKMLTLQERWEANEAKKAYNVDMAAFKENPPVITKDKVNTQYNSRYCSLQNLVDTVSPVLAKHGVAHRWIIEQNGIIKVTCILTHRLGHSESVSMSAPDDTSGSKNPIQQKKSTVTRSEDKPTYRP